MLNNKLLVFLGQSQIIKIMRSNKQPLTQESMRAIVKEVTGFDSTNVKVSLKCILCQVDTDNYAYHTLLEYIPMC